jgi:hypothetical protein
MESNQKAGTIELDQTQLLGIDQAPNQPLPETTFVARVGEKLLIGFAANVGSKPSNATKDAGLANLTKVGFKDNLRRWRKDRTAPSHRLHRDRRLARAIA